MFLLATRIGHGLLSMPQWQSKRERSRSVPSASTDTIDSVRGQASQLLHSIVEQATSRAMDASNHGSRKRQITNRFSRSKKTSPSVRDIAFNAASGAIELWQAARD